MLNSGRVALLDSQRLVNQFVGLERKVARGGRESIDHCPGGHDDIANAVAGAIGLASQPIQDTGWWFLAGDGPVYFDRRHSSQPAPRTVQRSYIP